MTDDIKARMIVFLPKLRRFAFVLTRNLESAEDLVQDTCERALSRLDQWERGTKLESWMYRIAHNIWLDQKRSDKVRGTTIDLEDAGILPGDDGRDITESRLTLAAVAKAMERLPEDQQVLISLVCVEGLSYKDAAGVLDVPIGTVMSRLARARQSLFQYMSPVAGAAPSTPTQERRHGSSS